ncbi:MAG: tRNA modification GTPase MnmE [Pirellulaceae bacterium]|nr:MAG: tRNA modification GTPase MnmE [Pirellulaceae bacterium]
MIPDLNDTIVAVASHLAGAARGVIRISGPDMADCLERLVHPPELVRRSGRLPGACQGWVRVAFDDHPRTYFVPARILLWPTGRSYTRQPSAELHLPGSLPVLHAVLGLACQSGARLAYPGEFTLRAFLAGRLDLAQAEAVLGVIQAQDERQLSVALRQLAGGVSNSLEQLRQTLLDLLADVEAGLDFVEEDIRFITAGELRERLTTACQTLQKVADHLTRRHLFDGCYRVVLRGAPNAGKSSLFNALLGRPAAIVSEREGTTRDYLTAELEIGTFRVRLIDSAGGALPDKHGTQTPLPAGKLDALMSRMTEQAAETAHLELWCFDVSRPWSDETLAELLKTLPANSLIVWCKADLTDASDRVERWGGILVSSHCGTGLAELRQAIASRLGDTAHDEVMPLTAARCQDAVQDARSALQEALRLADCQAGDELVAGQLRAALDALGRLTGRVYTEDVLDRVFSRFCIGK